jgi:CheY-like chemotaxis protein
LASPVIHSPTRILVVDDNRDAADSLGTLLAVLGADVRVEHDGTAALDVFSAYRPKVVFLDVGMPGMDGYEVARRIRQQPASHDVTLVALTGWGQERDRRDSVAAGFDHHLTKPADIAALHALLMKRQ